MICCSRSFTLIYNIELDYTFCDGKWGFFPPHGKGGSDYLKLVQGGHQLYGAGQEGGDAYLQPEKKSPDCVDFVSIAWSRPLRKGNLSGYFYAFPYIT